ncbi:MAG TPA: hypothetical protein VK117_16195 [Pyrinomonadaceae bacterium]|nr:hypothetical protein [Pyrinomonadaceae bacterium]
MRNNTRQVMRYVVMALVIALAFTLLAESTMAQCVMCRASLGNNSVFMRNLNIGVLVLLVPPVSIFCTIFILAIRHRRAG